MKEKGEITIGFKKLSMIVVLIIVLGMFMLGYLTRCKKDDKETVVTFTYDEILLIEKFQKQLNEDFGDVEVRVYKTKNGRLMMGWDN